MQLYKTKTKQKGTLQLKKEKKQKRAPSPSLPPHPHLKIQKKEAPKQNQPEEAKMHVIYCCQRKWNKTRQSKTKRKNKKEKRKQQFEKTKQKTNRALKSLYHCFSTPFSLPTPPPPPHPSHHQEKQLIVETQNYEPPAPPQNKISAPHSHIKEEGKNMCSTEVLDTCTCRCTDTSSVVISWKCLAAICTGTVLYYSKL